MILDWRLNECSAGFLGNLTNFQVALTRNACCRISLITSKVTVCDDQAHRCFRSNPRREFSFEFHLICEIAICYVVSFR